MKAELLITLLGMASLGAEPTLTESTSVVVFLTVSSVATPSGRHRFIEMNWVQDDMLRSDDAMMHLYDADPAQPGRTPLVSVAPSNKGYFRTHVRFPEQIFSEGNLTDSCLGFWMTLESGGTVRATTCLRARPHWMHDARDLLGNLSLVDLMLPGTHNAGSYASYDDVKDSLLGRYIYTQEENVWSQLVYGIRYLDLRVAYSSRKGSQREEFWITHSAFRTDVTVREVASQVRRFLAATKEVVVMDFHRFVAGFREKRAARRRHAELLSLLEAELGEFMIPTRFTSAAPLRLLWDSGRRLYVGYADERARARSARLFPAVRHLWGDADTKETLRTFLNRTVCDGRRRARLTSAMAQLTPTASGVLFNTYGGLRNMADQVNRLLTEWFRDEWNDCANIVATDFFLGNNIIQVAVETNRRRATRNDFFEE